MFCIIYMFKKILTKIFENNKNKEYFSHFRHKIMIKSVLKFSKKTNS